MTHNDVVTRLEKSGYALPSTGTEARDAKLAHMFGHFKDLQTRAGERALLGLLGGHAHDAALAMMVPNILANTIPKILAEGSAFFTLPTGHPYKYGTAFAPPEYSLLYIERLMRDSLPTQNDVARTSIPAQSPVHDILICMWLFLYNYLDGPQRTALRKRLGSGDVLLSYLPGATGNVLTFPDGA